MNIEVINPIEFKNNGFINLEKPHNCERQSNSNTNTNTYRCTGHRRSALSVNTNNNSTNYHVESDHIVNKPVQAKILADKFLILDDIDGSSLKKCVRIDTQQELVCKIVTRGVNADALLSSHFLLDSLENVNHLQEIVIGDKSTYLFFPPSYGDLHSHVRSRKRLREPEAKKLFKQIITTIRDCHEKGVILRDLKLRKFVFSDESRTQLKFESLEDAVVLEDTTDDSLQDKRGCPAYVSPEILRAFQDYSGRAADMWSAGVILYTMLVGRYPFNDTAHANLFARIARGTFNVPECLSARARCLIRSLLRREPSERLSAEEVLEHPWLKQAPAGQDLDYDDIRENCRTSGNSSSNNHDQKVPVFMAFNQSD